MAAQRNSGQQRQDKWKAKHIQLEFVLAIPRSLTIFANDGRGITLFFMGVFVALGSLIIPE